MDSLADQKLPLIIAERCGGLIRALASVKPDKSHPEVYDYEHPVFSHPLDALRYLLINIGQESVHVGKITGGIWGMQF